MIKTTQWSTQQFREYLKTGKVPDSEITKINFDKPQEPLIEKVFKGKPIPNITNPTLELLKQKQAIFIPGNTPSLKNSREIEQRFTGKSKCCFAPYIKREHQKPICTKCHKETEYGTAKVIGYSKPVKKYFETSKQWFESKKIYFDAMFFNEELPYKVGLYFVRDSYRMFDLNNASAIISDLMRDYKWIHDDSVQYFVPINIPPYFHVDPLNAGCYIIKINKNYESKILEFL